MTCAHHQIQTWRAADTGEPLMWSCVDCARKFVPLTRQMIDGEALLHQAADMLETMPIKHPDQIAPRDALVKQIKERIDGTS